MKKILAIALALAMLATSASAITVADWDMGAASQSAASAATQLWQEQNKPVEPEKPVLPEWILDLINFWKWW